MILKPDYNYNVYYPLHDKICAFAAGELTKYLSQVFAGKIRITIHDIHDKKQTDNAQTAIIVLNPQNGNKFTKDRFLLKIDQTEIEISGSNSRSILSGVYVFLEQCGCIWSRPGIDTIPRKKFIFLHTEKFAYTALLDYRGFYIDSCAIETDENFAVKVIDWLTKKRGNYLLVSVNFFTVFKPYITEALQARGIILEAGHHGFVNFVDPEKHFSRHPEWFSYVNGERAKGKRLLNMLHNSQLCSANAQGLDYYAGALCEFLEKNQEIDILGIIPNDGFGWCECGLCREIEGAPIPNPLFSGENEQFGYSAGRRYHTIVNHAARVLKKTFPHKKASFWAYHAMIMPSEFVSAFPDNLVLSGLALYQRCYTHALANPVCCRAPHHLNYAFTEIIEKWKKAFTGDIIIYEYYAKYAWLSLPKIMPDIIRTDLEYFCKSGISGIQTMAEKTPWQIYEINLAAMFGFSWESGQKISAKQLLKNYSREVFPGNNKPFFEILQAVNGVMRHFGLLGGRYPGPVINKGIKTLKSCMIRAARMQKKITDKKNTGFLLLKIYILNLRYTIMHFQSNNIMFKLCSRGLSGQERTLLLKALLSDEKKIMHYIQKIKSSGAILYSGFIDERLARRYQELQKLLAGNQTPDVKTVRQIYEKYYF